MASCIRLRLLMTSGEAWAAKALRGLPWQSIQPLGSNTTKSTGGIVSAAAGLLADAVRRSLRLLTEARLRVPRIGTTLGRIAPIREGLAGPSKRAWPRAEVAIETCRVGHAKRQKVRLPFCRSANRIGLL